MGTVPVTQTNFTSGIISNRARSRLDLARYFNACEDILNMILHVQGGVTSRPGLRMIQGTKDDGEARLIPFTFSQDQAYMLEFGPSYIRFYTQDGAVEAGGLPYEIVSPYTTIETIRALHYRQHADLLLLFHPDYAPRQLARFAPTTWTITPITFTPPPVRNGRIEPAGITCTPGNVSGAGVTFALAGGDLLAGDVGRRISINNGDGFISAVDTVLHTITVDIRNTLSSVDPAAPGDWYIDGETDGAVTLGGPRLDSFGWASMTFAANTFRTTDVGKYLAVYDGCIRIDQYISALEARGTVIVPLVKPAGGFAATTNWRFYESAWADGDYPATGALSKNRLLLAGSLGSPVQIDGSMTFDWFSFLPGDLDNHAIQFTLGAHQVDAISWIAGIKRQFIGTPAGPWTFGEPGSPVTPSDIQVEQELRLSCSKLQPVETNSVVLYVQGALRYVRELAYDYTQDNIQSPNLTSLSHHLTQKSGISALAYTEEPDSILWCVSGGVLLGMTYERLEKVIGWHRHVTQGDFEDVAVIPYNSRDEVWVIVKRTINGATKRFVEIIDPPTYETTEDITDCFQVDCGLSYDGVPASTFSVPHLIGEEVAILADGLVHPNQTVPGTGLVTLQYEASKVHIGLPYTSLIRPVEPELAPGQLVGLSRGKREARINAAKIAFENAAYAKVGPDEARAKQVLLGRIVMDQADPLFTGVKWVNGLRSRSGDAPTITILCDLPLPMTISQITFSEVVGDE